MTFLGSTHKTSFLPRNRTGRPRCESATAKVTYQFDKTPDTKTEVETTFVREDGAWKVCTALPS